MNLSMKQKQNQRLENRLVVAKGKLGETDGLGVRISRCILVIYRMDKQQG